MFCALALTGMALSTHLAQRIEGNAHAINKIGGLRMQSYRTLSALSLEQDHALLIQEIDQALNNEVLRDILSREALGVQFDKIKQDWHGALRSEITQATNKERIAASIDLFVKDIDMLVVALEEKTEQRIQNITYLQKLFIAAMLFFLFLAIVYLRYRIVSPLKILLDMAGSITYGDFSKRIALKHNDELNVLAQTLNGAASELGQSYHALEQRINEKTEALQRNNKTLGFLYETQRRLHDGIPSSDCIALILKDLSELVPLDDMHIALTDDDHKTFPEEEHTQSPYHIRCWSLDNEQKHFGILTGKERHNTPLNDEQKQLMATIADSFTIVLALEHQKQQREQWMLMEERSAIARELHDSIAQSLSYLKIRLAYLQMQKSADAEELHRALVEMRQEVDTAYRQLRELLTTFRLRLDRAGLFAALESAVNEFGEKLGFPITFHYQIEQSLPPEQTIHVLQIAREALSNIYKHAQATEVTVDVREENQYIVFRVCDNGHGMDHETKKKNHYGLVIMRDRTQSLNGAFHIENREAGGLEVRVTFPVSKNQKDDKHE